MVDASWKTLFHPFEAGFLGLPGKQARVLFVNAEPGFRLPEGFEADLVPVQDLRPAFLALQAAGYAPLSHPEGESFDLALVLCGRHRGRNELWIADAIRRVRPGGRLVVAGGKTDGVASLRKRLGDYLEIEGHASKHHGVVFWLTRPADPVPAIEILESSNPSLTLEGGFRTVAGLFSYDRVDAGSKLLADNLPDRLKGAAADFGAGWGYLSARLSQVSPGIASIDLYETSFAACETARKNMAALAPQAEARIIWHDLLGEKVERRYDVVVVNPPFHRGRAAEPSMGDAMIHAASKALKPGGRLFLVANRPLPYETALQACFARHGEICRDERFKVLWAVR